VFVAAVATPAMVAIAVAMTPAVMVVVVMVVMTVVIFAVTPSAVAITAWSGIGSALRPCARRQPEHACAQYQLMQFI
jgi:hypothetical protein